MPWSARLVVTLAVGLASLPVYAQDAPPYGRLIIASTSRWGDGLSGVVKNLGPGKMCSVVIQAHLFAEDLNPTPRGDYGTTKVVTQDLGTLEANAETTFNLNSVFVRERMPGLSVTGSPCR
jgi:hypothetical protein